ncbi:hypothetical protein Tco_0710232 [Tanacetum coccineum]
MEDMDFVQKAKVRWAIEGDENSKYFHGIINKKRSNLAIRGVFVDGTWCTDPILVKKAFKDHYEARFNKPTKARLKLSFSFPNRLSTDQVTDLERHVSHDEIRLAVWDCGVNKSPGPDGFTFEFFRKFLDCYCPDFCEALSISLNRASFSKGASMLEKKISWIAWDKVLASKKKGGLGVSSYFALNRALLLKWVWRFVSQDDSMVSVFSKRSWGEDDSHSVRNVSIWSSILKEVQVLKSSGFDFLSYCSKRIGDGQSTSFWKETWMGDIPLLVLSTSNDRWYFSLSSSGEFSVKDTRLAIEVDASISFEPLGVFASCLPWWRIDFQLWRFRSHQNGMSGSLLFVFRVQLKVFWKESSTLLGGLFGDFGIVLLLMLISRLDRSFLRILSLPPFFGVIVGVVESSLGMIGLKTRI